MVMEISSKDNNRSPGNVSLLRKQQSPWQQNYFKELPKQLETLKIKNKKNDKNAFIKNYLFGVLEGRRHKEQPSSKH